MVNRRAFFEIFFYNRENPSRELMEAAEGVWRAYMKKYGLGLDASTDGQPTYEEVKEISLLANAAIEMVEKQIAEAEAEEARRKKIQREAWDLGLSVEQYMSKMAAPAAAEEVTEAAAEDIAEEEAVEEVAEAAAEEEAEAIVEEPAEAPAEEIPEAAAEAEPVPVILPEKKAAEIRQMPVEPVSYAGPVSDVSLWVEQLTHWCQSKGMQCIRTVDNGDYYLHVYLPHKKDVYTVGKWCFKADTRAADLAAEISNLYAYCEGYANCFAQLVK